MKSLSDCRKDFSVIDCKDNIIIFSFDRVYDLAMSFVRVQEFQESPEFCGKTFDLEDFMDWYSNEYGKGSFTYPSDWSGFNVSGATVSKWLKTVKTLRTRERALFNPYKFKVFDNPFYFIGICNEKNPMKVLCHEMCHAMYTVSTEYRNACDEIIHAMPVGDVRKMYKWLGLKGYHSDVFMDELQAYWSTGGHKDIDGMFNTKGRKKRWQKGFENLYTELVLPKVSIALERIRDDKNK